MSTKPLVSVVTIFYNAERFLPEAIESVLNQTYAHWELLLVDDGSTDQSPGIARRYAEQYPEKIRCFEHEGHRNLGKSTSRNLGIRQARGEYLLFLDADDVLLPQKIEHQAAILAAQPEAAMVYGRAEYWFSWEGSRRDRGRDFVSKLGISAPTLIKPPALAARFLRDQGMVPCLCSLLTRRQAIEATGGFDESIQNLYEDQVFIFKICLQFPTFVDGACGERYRQHRDSSSFLAFQNGEYHPWWPNPARLAFLSWLSGYLSARGIEDAWLQKALQRAFWPYRYPHLYRLVSPVQALMAQFFVYLDLLKQGARSADR